MSFSNLAQSKTISKMKLIGDNVKAKLDDKGRVIVPALFKKRLLAAEVTSFVLKKDNSSDCLLLYPKNVWDDKDDYLNSKLNDFDPAHKLFKAEFYRDTFELDMDGSGRLNLPKNMMEKVGIEKELLVKGSGTNLEFWKPEVYEGEALSSEAFMKLGKEIFGSDSNL